MTPIHLLFFVFPLFTATHIVKSPWVQTQVTKPPPQNLTKLHFYFHDIERGNNKSVAIIATPENTTVFDFGTLVMVDEPLTAGPDRRSDLIGWAQGMYGVASRTRRILFMTMTFSFMHGSYNGSSFSVLGKYNVDDEVREFPIIGGTGVFKFARGYAIVKRYKYSGTKDENTAEYNVFVLHSNTNYFSMF